MAERSKAPDSRVELFLTGVFWSTNVGVGSNPTSDKRFSVIEIQMRIRASWCAVTNARIINAQLHQKMRLFVRFRFLLKWCFWRKPLVENRGIDPRTSRMLSERSTI